MPFLECISIDTCMFLYMTCLSSWYVYTRAMLNEERKIVSKYCVGWPACCSQQMGEDCREDLKGLFCVRQHVIFIQLLRAHASIGVCTCLPPDILCQNCRLDMVYKEEAFIPYL